MGVIGVVSVGLFFARPKPAPANGEAPAARGVEGVVEGVVSVPAPTSTGTEVAAHPAAHPISNLSPEDTRKVKVLDEVLSTKNDNDPRIDTELKALSPAVKEAIRARYEGTQPEKRNERGTLVFLLGREIRDSSDLAFFAGVLSEKPCLSLQDCGRPPEAHSGDEDHFESINETTANYPQLMALLALKERALKDSPTKEASQGPLYQSILQTLRAGGASANPKVAIEAKRILEDLENEGGR